MRDADTSSIERWRRRIGRTGLLIIAVLFLAGLILWLVGQERASVSPFLAACGLLVLTPLVNVAAALAEEIRRQDWPFAAAAAVVLLVLAYSIATAFV
jgi:uncharacterized membrane protein